MKMMKNKMLNPGIWVCPSNNGRYSSIFEVANTEHDSVATIIIECKGLESDGAWKIELKSLRVSLESWIQVYEALQDWLLHRREFNISLTTDGFTSVSLVVQSKADDIVLTVGKVAWRIRWRAMGFQEAETVWEVDEGWGFSCQADKFVETCTGSQVVCHVKEDGITW